ncbi:hypothetical protein [Pseudomonas nunensis]|uniref:hypothetical protein n=1 Tax=Pseudomonas nunensis TaxID=2961896 RepID=UPI0025B1C852|nr:hypothetical protein [Pseudomonas nunensis]MDN3221807.1 hypothetical protein [Pseudomonas nunensis]
MSQISGTQPQQAGDRDISFGNDGYLYPSTEPGQTFNLACAEDAAVTHATELNGKIFVDRALANGAKDPAFASDLWNFESGDTSRSNRLLLQPFENDRRIVVIGESIQNRTSRPAVTRLLPNGSPDLVFGCRILPQPDDHQTNLHFLYPTSDGCLHQGNKVLVIANYMTGTVYRDVTRLYCLEITGDLDERFGQSGFIDIRFHDQSSLACAVQVQRNGNIVVAGKYGTLDNMSLARYSPSGVLDETFGELGFIDIPIERSAQDAEGLANIVYFHSLSRLLILDDDRIVLTGNTIGPGKTRGVLLQLTAEGQRDSSFNGGEPIYTEHDLANVGWATAAVQPDGKIIVAGSGFDNAEPGVNRVIGHKQRFLPSGARDLTFDNTPVSGEFRDIAIQPSGRILLAGSQGVNWQFARHPSITAFIGN